MTDINTAMSTNALSVNSLNISIKSQRFSEWIKKRYNYMLSIKKTQTF